MFDMYDVVIQEGEVLITVHNRAVRTLKAGTYETTKHNNDKKKNTHTQPPLLRATFYVC
jgi:hypothetical protein